MKTIERLTALEKARRELRGVPIPWYEFELAVFEVAKANPQVEGDDLAELVAETVLENWSKGMG